VGEGYLQENQLQDCFGHFPLIRKKDIRSNVKKVITKERIKTMAYKLLLVYKDDLITEVAERWDIPQIITNKAGDEVKKVKFIPSTREIKKALKNDYKKRNE